MVGLGLLLFAILEVTVVGCCVLICGLLFRLVLLLVNSVGVVVYTVYICCWFCGLSYVWLCFYGYLFIVVAFIWIWFGVCGELLLVVIWI